MSDDKVVVPVEMTRDEVEKGAVYGPPIVADACRRWLADNPEPEPEPERVEFRLYPQDGDRSYKPYKLTAVPAEALRPGDRVAGRVVESVKVDSDNEVAVRFREAPDLTYWYAHGTLVLLDGDGDQ